MYLHDPSGIAGEFVFMRHDSTLLHKYYLSLNLSVSTNGVLNVVNLLEGSTHGSQNSYKDILSGVPLLYCRGNFL